jgi:hypothetical protein
LRRQHRDLLSDTKGIESAKDELDSSWSRLVRRRKFLQGLGAAGAVGAALPATRLFAQSDKKLSKDDANLLQLALTIELIEADLWQQYNELGGAVDRNDHPNRGNPAYIAALQNLDGDMPQYISDYSSDSKIEEPDSRPCPIRKAGRLIFVTIVEAEALLLAPVLILQDTS